MALPVPNLDDRRFQDLVDDAKRMVMRRCPEWTDHNVSDPGVTLIETFAYMTDQLLFRLNQVPDRLYVKFLDMIGLRLIPATPAEVPVTFWLSAPAITSVGVAMGTSVATPRTDLEESILFSTRRDLQIVPCALSQVATQSISDDAPIERTEELKLGRHFAAFSAQPQVDDVLLVGLTDPVPSCVVRLDFDCHVEGVGVHPEQPPLVWEAWTGDGWTECMVSSDGTAALNKAGGVLVHVPDNHEASVLVGQRAGWLRARVIAVPAEFPTYSDSPVIMGLSASTVGGTAPAIHAEIVDVELLGMTEGVAGQQFRISRAPLLGGVATPSVEVSSDDGWQEWRPVSGFAWSGPTDQHYLLDEVAGTVSFGPAVRDVDGSVRQHGAVPAAGETVRIRRYATGGGRTGNVGKGTIRTLKSSIPFVDRVENLDFAKGGVDAETIDEAKARGPILLRTRSRAVTAEDYEAIVREIAPELARVRCVTAGEDDVQAGAVRVLVVPAASEEGGIKLGELVPDAGMLQRIAEHLDQVRLIGTRVLVEPPRYRGITVVTRLVARPRVDTARIRTDALAALYAYLNPISGGPDGTGWPFGRPVASGEIFGLLQRVRGVDMVEDVRLFGANPVTGVREGESQRIELDPCSLVFSYEHQVRVEQH